MTGACFTVGDRKKKQRHCVNHNMSVVRPEFSASTQLTDEAAPWAQTYFQSDCDVRGFGNVATVASTGSYTDLTGTPQGVSAFENDRGFLVQSDGVYAAGGKGGVGRPPAPAGATLQVAGTVEASGDVSCAGLTADSVTAGNVEATSVVADKVAGNGSALTCLTAGAVTGILPGPTLPNHLGDGTLRVWDSRVSMFLPPGQESPDGCWIEGNVHAKNLFCDAIILPPGPDDPPDAAYILGQVIGGTVVGGGLLYGLKKVYDKWKGWFPAGEEIGDEFLDDLRDAMDRREESGEEGSSSGIVSWDTLRKRPLATRNTGFSCDLGMLGSLYTTGRIYREPGLGVLPADNSVCFTDITNSSREWVLDVGARQANLASVALPDAPAFTGKWSQLAQDLPLKVTANAVTCNVALSAPLSAADLSRGTVPVPRLPLGLDCGEFKLANVSTGANTWETRAGLGAGILLPQAKLHVDGGIQAASLTGNIDAASLTSGKVLPARLPLGLDTSELIIKSVGGENRVQVGLSAGDPGSKLTVNGNVAATYFLGTATRLQDYSQIAANVPFDNVGTTVMARTGASVQVGAGNVKLFANGVVTCAGSLTAGSLAGSGAGLTNVPASSITGNTLALTGASGLGAQAGLVLSTFNPGTNPPSAKVVATDTGGYGCTLDLQTKVSGAAGNPLASRLLIASSGKVGIANAAPTEALTVGGGVQASYYVGNGAALTSLSASQVTTGTLSANVLPMLPAAKVSGLATVATSGNYNDLANKPSINNESDGSMSVLGPLLGLAAGTALAIGGQKIYNELGRMAPAGYEAFQDGLEDLDAGKPTDSDERTKTVSWFNLTDRPLAVRHNASGTKTLGLNGHLCMSGTIATAPASLGSALGDSSTVFVSTDPGETVLDIGAKTATLNTLTCGTLAANVGNTLTCTAGVVNFTGNVAAPQVTCEGLNASSTLNCNTPLANFTGSTAVGTEAKSKYTKVTGAASIGGQGGYTDWNRVGGTGAMSFINHRGVGGGGWNWIGAEFAGNGAVVTSTVLTLSRTGDLATTGSVTAGNVSVGAGQVTCNVAVTAAGVRLTNNDPGVMIEKRYTGTGIDPTQARCGLGQYPNGVVELYSWGTLPSASVNLGFATGESTFVNALTATKTGVTVPGTLGVTGAATLGNVQAASFTGNGSQLTGLNASTLASGTVPAARLPNGLGDGTLQVAAGKVGVGTATPSEALAVVGNVQASFFKGDGSQLTGIAGSQVGDGSLFVGAGKVGVGTSAPAEALQVAGNVQATFFKGDGSQLTGIVASQVGDGTLYAGGGKVGIGTTAPAQVLDVRGNAVVSGGLTLGDGVQCTGNCVMERRYATLRTAGSNRYGMDAGSGSTAATRVYGPENFYNSTAPSIVCLSFATGEGTYRDVLTASRGGGVTVLGGVTANTGLLVTNNDPGALVEKRYTGAADRYGVGQYPNGALRMYAANALGSATVSLGFATGETTFSDVIQCKQNGAVRLGTAGSLFTQMYHGCIPIGDSAGYNLVGGKVTLPQPAPNNQYTVLTSISTTSGWDASGHINLICTVTSKTNLGFTLIVKDPGNIFNGWTDTGVQVNWTAIVPP